MGAWGTSIFSDDLASDIRREFKTLVGSGKSVEEAEILLYEYYWDRLGEVSPDRMVYSFALALTEWKSGRLTDTAKELALYFIDRGGDLVFWDTPGNEKNLKKRAQVLEELKKTLLSPQPAPKRIPKPKVHRSPYKVGDLLLYQFGKSGYHLDSPFLDKYFLLRVVAIKRKPLSQLLPDEIYDEYTRVGLYRWYGEEIPAPSVINELEFIPFREYTEDLPEDMPKEWTEGERIGGKEFSQKIWNMLLSDYGHHIYKTYSIPDENETDNSFILLDREQYFSESRLDYFDPPGEGASGSLVNLEYYLIDQLSDLLSEN